MPVWDPWFCLFLKSIFQHLTSEMRKGVLRLRNLSKVTQGESGRAGNSNLFLPTSDAEGRVRSLSGSKKVECLSWVFANKRHFCKQRRAFPQRQEHWQPGSAGAFGAPEGAQQGQGWRGTESEGDNCEILACPGQDVCIQLCEQREALCGS